MYTKARGLFRRRTATPGKFRGVDLVGGGGGGRRFAPLGPRCVEIRSAI